MGTHKHNPATAATIRKNEEMYSILDFGDKQEAEFARRGLIAAVKNIEIRNAAGDIIWSQADADFLDEMEKRGYTFYIGKGPYAAMNMIQIANMGEIYEQDCYNMLNVVKDCLNDMKK